MAYKRYAKKRYRKRTYHPQRALVSRRQPDAFDYARTAYQGVKKIWKLINTEHHNIDGVESDTIQNSGTLYNLAVVPIGDDNNSRSGIAIRPQNIGLRFSITIATASLSSLVRVIVFRGKGENGTNIVYGDLFGTTGVLNFKTYDQRFKTKFLYDRVFTMSNGGNTRVIHVNTNIPLMGHINYDQATTNGTVYQDGGLYMAVVSNETTNAPTFTLRTRLLFTDN